MAPEDFNNHIVFDKLEQLNQKLKDDELKENIDIEKFSFFESVYLYISDRIKITIPILVQEVELSAIASELDTGVQQINSYLGNKNIGHLTNAVNNFNTAINRIRNFPLPFAKNDFNFSKTIANFQKSLSQKYKLMEDENLELKQKIDTLHSELEAKINEVDDDLNNTNTKLDQLIQLIEDKEKLVNDLTTNFQKEYDEIHAKSTKIFEEDREKFRKEIDDDKYQYSGEISQLKQDIDTDTSGLIEKLNKKLEEAKKIVNVVGNIGVTGNFQKIANEHKKTADFWRIIAIIFMSILSGLFIYTIWDISHGASFDWIKSLIRVIAAAALSYPATYAARESSKHRNLEFFNKRNELELASIEPFIELLDDAEKNKIKSDLVEKYFGKNTYPAEKFNIDEDIPIGIFERILKSIMPLVKK